MPELTTVTFDLWHTLLLDTPEQGRIRSEARLEGAQAVLRGAGEEFDLEHIRRAYGDCAQYCRSVRERNLDLAFREQVGKFIDNIAPALQLRLPEAVVLQIVAVYADAFLEHPPQPHPSALRVLQETRAAGLRMALISNTAMTPGVTFRQFLEQHEMLGFFDVLTFSDELKWSKPGPQPFLSTLEQMQAAPECSVHVGDHFVHDICGAKGVGMKAIWIEGFSERPDDAGPEVAPDVSISSLSAVPGAIRELTAR